MGRKSAARPRGQMGRLRGSRSASSCAGFVVPKAAVKPVRVDITMWLDGSARTEIHVHEDPNGDGPLIAFGDLTGFQMLDIAVKLRDWTRRLYEGVR